MAVIPYADISLIRSSGHKIYDAPVGAFRTQKNSKAEFGPAWAYSSGLLLTYRAEEQQAGCTCIKATRAD